MPKSLVLDGVTVLVTRPEQQAAGLIKQLQQHGAGVIHQPAIAISAYTDNTQDSIISQIDAFDWLIFISTNAVDYGLELINRPTDQLPRIAAIGQATRDRLISQGCQNVFCPASDFTSEALLNTEAFSANQIRGQKILIIRGVSGREHLKQTLEQRQATVSYLEVYQTQPAKRLVTQQQLRHINCIMISSQQGLENLVSMFDSMTVELIFDKLLIVPGQRCQLRASELGFKRIKIADNATDDAMLNCIINTIRDSEPLQ